MPATANIARHADRLNRLSTLAKGGGILLTGVGLYAGCLQIGSAKTQEEKNGIFVESVSSATVGTIGGIALGVFLTTNPVGWGVSLVLAAGTVATSFGSGKFSRWVYDKNFRKVDLVGMTGTDQLCQ